MKDILQVVNSNSSPHYLNGFILNSWSHVILSIGAMIFLSHRRRAASWQPAHSTTGHSRLLWLLLSFFVMRSGGQGHQPQVLIFSKDGHKEATLFLVAWYLIFLSVNYNWIRESVQELQLLSAGGVAAAALCSCLPAEWVPGNSYWSLHPRYLQPCIDNTVRIPKRKKASERLSRQRILNTEASAIMKAILMRQVGWTFR